MLRDRFAQNDTGYEIPPLRGCFAIGDGACLGMTIRDRMEDEYARPLLSQYLETAGREDFIPCEEARKEWELE